jgi:hypothetical protein
VVVVVLRPFGARIVRDELDEAIACFGKAAPPDDTPAEFISNASDTARDIICIVLNLAARRVASAKEQRRSQKSCPLIARSAWARRKLWVTQCSAARNAAARAQCCGALRSMHAPTNYFTLLGAVETLQEDRRKPMLDLAVTYLYKIRDVRRV